MTSETRRFVDSIAAKFVQPYLMPLGFKRKGLTWNRIVRLAGRRQKDESSYSKHRCTSGSACCREEPEREQPAYAPADGEPETRQPVSI